MLDEGFLKSWSGPASPSTSIFERSAMPSPREAAYVSISIRDGLIPIMEVITVSSATPSSEARIFPTG